MEFRVGLYPSFNLFKCPHRHQCMSSLLGKPKSNQVVMNIKHHKLVLLNNFSITEHMVVTGVWPSWNLCTSSQTPGPKHLIHLAWLYPA